MKDKLLFFGLLTTCLAMPLSVNSQMFGDENDVTPSYSAEPAKPAATKDNSGFVPPAKLMQSAQPATKTAPAAKNIAKPTTAPAEKNAAAPAASAAKTSQTQQTQAEQPVVKKPLNSDVKQYKIVNGKMVEDEEKEAIYIYYKDFKMVRGIGRIACDVRFVLVTKLSETLSSISMRLVWPNLATKLTFDRVKPGEENYYDYRFYGDGCYSMDKLPNVTVNRCRLKGRSQKDCASLVQLMTWVDD